jgi:hypothetical protein
MYRDVITAMFVQYNVCNMKAQWVLQQLQVLNPLTPELRKFLRATLPDPIFYWIFCFLNLHYQSRGEHEGDQRKTGWKE